MSGILNNLGAVSGVIGTTVGAGGFESGTKCIFNQTAAPTGWTKVTGIDDDQSLRVTTGTVGTGGTVAFETAFASHTPTITPNNASFQLLDTHLSSHTHTYLYDAGAGLTGADTYGYKTPGSVHSVSTASTGGDTAHIHANAPASSAIDLNVKFVDVIIATKD
jgi:hypothetical protein